MSPESSPTERSGLHRGTPRLVVGFSIMIAGLVLALDSIGIVDAGAILPFWPLALVAVGVTKWATSGERSGGLAWAVVGLALLLVTFGRMPVVRFWAVLLFVFGAHIAWRALRPAFAEARDETARIDMNAVLGGVKTVSYASDFRGGQALAILGGCDLDLRHASIPEGGEALIDTFAFWGGIEIKIPEEWEVINRGTALLGGFDNKTRPLPGANRRLIVTGIAVMGGVEVKN